MLKVALLDVEQDALDDEAVEPVSRTVTTRPAEPAPRDDEILPQPPGQMTPGAVAFGAGLWRGRIVSTSVPY